MVFAVVAALAIPACARVSDEGRGAGATPSSLEPTRDCAAVWTETRERVRASGKDDGEARRQADLARARCEGLQVDDYPSGATPTPSIEPVEAACSSHVDRRDAPPPPDPATVAVYFSCVVDLGTEGEPVYMHERSVSPQASRKARLVTALQEYLRGPTAAEAAQGYVSGISDALSGVDFDISIAGSAVTIDFSEGFQAIGAFASTQGMIFLAELTALVFQLPGIRTLELQVEGDCDRFWRHLESSCHPLERTG